MWHDPSGDNCGNQQATIPSFVPRDDDEWIWLVIQTILSFKSSSYSFFSLHPPPPPQHKWMLAQLQHELLLRRTFPCKDVFCLKVWTHLSILSWLSCIHHHSRMPSGRTLLHGVRVKSPLSMPWNHIGETEVHHQWISTAALRWRWVASLTPHQLPYPDGKALSTHTTRWWMGPTFSSDICEKEINLVHLSAFRPQVIWPMVLSSHWL
jgi:hypothetical protein